MAYQGIDFRDVFMPGGGPSRLTLRRLWLLILALPWDSPFWMKYREDNPADDGDGKPAELTPEQRLERLRSQQERYEKAREKAEQATTEEA